MKITAVRVSRLEGRIQEGLAVFHSLRAGQPAREPAPHRETFVEIETDEGITGLQYVSRGAEREVKEAGQLLLGDNPLHIEAIWKKLWTSVDLRQRVPIIAVLDLALWDLIGKIRNAPVYELLGGPVRERVRAYAGMLGFSIDPTAAAEASVEYVEKGFTALKWYLPYNGTYGREGILGNVAIIKAVREAIGSDVEIMIDLLLSNPRPNSILWITEMARQLEEYHPTWIEEPLNFDDLDTHRRLAEATSIPLAFGEHFYTRWQIRQIIETGSPTIIQPDPIWAGGVTEMRKIIAVCSTYGVAVVPHGNESCRNNLHILFAQPERNCPLGEWGVRINPNSQHFYTDFYEPIDGYYSLPNGPGFGYALDDEKIVKSTEL
ncbi:MAG: mandelate racemase/muconate lactonizing enzyme family protein [SAR202 cluster bacterium]|jgi:L-alanine-DL-glutamate epimerase-like enolase superfamily enzyme|nr:mandelate racemase/muconate lactonizing enzyme family protein [SAR202 cluster bacterium]MDP6514932.1 mandelate racemase/muconate lactonizing enzyme family protein [SAR202 cluster bacterium]MDP6714798.1 mandelate racemase/muconate lactonizing enzyme family protein [SAR202 cluster bacterium]